MGDVATIHGAPDPTRNDVPDEDVVGRLESLLEQARSGRIRFFAFAASDLQDSTVTGWDGHCKSVVAMAAVSRLALRFGLADLEGVS